MYSRSISIPFTPRSMPSSTAPTPLKLRTSLYKSPRRPIQYYISSSSTTRPRDSLPKSLTDAGNLGLGFEFDPHPSLYSPSYSAPQAPPTAARGAESDVVGLLLRERIVFLGSIIDDFVADAIMSQLLLLDAQDPTKDIRLFINSPGGSLSATMAIYDVVQLLRTDVSTIALGIAASTSSIILGSGTKGKRLAMPNTRIMIHQPLVEAPVGKQ